MRNRLIGLCILGWVLGMYSLTIFAVKQEVLLDADFEKKISKYKICYTDVIICIATYIDICIWDV